MHEKMAVEDVDSPVFPHVTVEDVWRGALPAESQLVGGARGLHREVVWCTALRARPPAFTPLRGGELLLVDPQVLSAVDGRLTLARLLGSLPGQNVAGAVVKGRVASEARRVADDQGLPLLALPAGSHLDQVEQEVLRYVVDRRAALHERAQDLQRQLSELALAGRGLSALLQRLHELTGVPVLLEREGSVQYVGAGTLSPSVAEAVARERGSLDDWLRQVPLSAFDPPVALRRLGEGQARLIAPILVQGGIAGFLSLLGSEGELGELHRLAIGRAAHACAIEVVRANALRAARDEVAGELFDVLTSGRSDMHDSARERAKRKGLDLDRPYLVVAAAGRAGEGGRLRAALEQQLATMRLPSLVRDRGDLALALIGIAGPRDPEPRALVDGLHRALGGTMSAPVAVGYSAVRSGTTEVAKAAREAEQAATMGRRLFGPDSATAFADLGLYRLLYALQGQPELGEFRDDVLGTLQAKHRGGALLQTLKAYLATNGSPTDTADRLHLHRNTVLYRLGRIEDLLGIDLRDAEVRLGLYLALKIAEVLESS
jgi:purine catabolism regulator